MIDFYRVPCSTKEEMELIVHSASEAQKKWREVPVQQRTRVMIKFQTLLVEHKDRIADVIVRENGKTKVDALGDHSNERHRSSTVSGCQR